MISFVKSIKVDNFDKTTRNVNICYANKALLVKSIKKDGTVRVVAENGTDIVSFCDLIVGCLYSESDFFKKISESFGYDINKICTSKIECEFNNVIFTAKREESVATIHKKWLAKIKYQTTPSINNNLRYRSKHAKIIKKKKRAKIVREEIIDIANSTEIEFKDEKAKLKWEEFLKNTRKYEAEFAVHWVKYMQHIMKVHDKIVGEIAYSTFRACDFKRRGIILTMHTADIIAECWKYSEDFKIWCTKKE